MADLAEVEELKRRFEGHLEDYRIQTSNNLERHARHEAMYEKNMLAIAALTASTQGVVNSWVTITSLQKFFKWLSGFAILGGFIYWLSHKLPLLISH